MASSGKWVPDIPSKAFLAGAYVFTRTEAINLYLLHEHAVSVWEMKQEYFPNATLEEIIVPIQIGGLLHFDFYNLDDLQELDKTCFDPSCVRLSEWNVGEPKQRNE